MARKDDKRSPPARISLSEIANLAEVSEATVSRVLNRRYGVSAQTREVVERAMKELGYLRPTEGELVLILTPGLANPFFYALTEQILAELLPYGLRALIGAALPGSSHEFEYVESTVGAGVGAVVFLSTSNTLAHADRTAQQLLSHRGIPYIYINGSSTAEDAPTFSTNDWIAATLAIDHLVDLGHARIGMLAGPVGNIPAERRVEGFVQAMDRHGLRGADDLIERQYFTFDGGRHGGDLLLDAGVTAIVAASDQMALGAIDAAHRRGLDVPSDISVVGYDDSEVLDFTNPPLTSVRQPREKLAQSTARAIELLLSNRAIVKGEQLFDPELRLRASTSSPKPQAPAPTNHAAGLEVHNGKEQTEL